jgi:GNAT superfamily N-acetyltransferase
MIVRQAELRDAAGMAALQNAVIRIGGTTAHEVERSVDEVAQAYLTGPTVLCAHVAEDQGRITGFQVLGLYPDMSERRGDIGTFVHPDFQRGGVGAALFAATVAWARAHGVPVLLAVIRADNRVGLGYYSRRGFVDCGTEPDITLKDGRVVGRIVKRFDVSA